jgi:hypothetical protein
MDVFGMDKHTLNGPAVREMATGKSFDPVAIKLHGKDALRDYANQLFVDERQAFISPAKIRDHLGIDTISIPSYEAAALYETYSRVGDQNIKRLKRYMKDRYTDFPATDKGSTQLREALVKNEAELIAIRRGIMIQEAIRETIRTGAISKETLRNLANYEIKTSSPKAVFNSLQEIIKKEFESGAKHTDKLFTGELSPYKSRQFFEDFRKETEYEEAVIRQLINIENAMEERGPVPQLMRAKAAAVESYYKAVRDAAAARRQERTWRIQDAIQSNVEKADYEPIENY